MKWEPEQIDDNHQRMKVPGGWIVKAYENVCTFLGYDYDIRNGYEWRVAMCFVPDPNHEWEIDNGN